MTSSTISSVKKRLVPTSANIIRVAIVGAGTRGTALATHAAALPGVAVVAVAEPNPLRRVACARAHDLADNACFKTWQDLAATPLPFDAAIIATLDNAHAAPALALLARGCHLLIEKPLADTAADAAAIRDASHDAGTVVAVCHTLRFMEPVVTIRERVATGAIGTLVHIEQMEAIGHIRFTHNYVRGQWGDARVNTALLIHKCCHDIDYLAWLAGTPCQTVASSGALSFFHPGNRPSDATLLCLDCPRNTRCLYSALRLYVDTDRTAWPARTISADHSREAHLAAVRSGPWNRCVWQAGNNVVDHQAVLLTFSDDATATCTLSGYSATNGRRLRIHGTEGELFYDEAARVVSIARFDGAILEPIPLPLTDVYHPEDRQIVVDWVRAMRDPARPPAVTPTEACRTLAIVFAAEHARLEGTGIDPYSTTTCSSGAGSGILI